MSVFDKRLDEKKEDEAEKEEEEEEEEEEIIQNEEPLQPIDPTFKNLVLQTKKTLYKNIVLSPPLNTKKAQDNKLLISYLQKLTFLRKLCLHVQYHTITKKGLNKIIANYPDETHHMIKTLVQWLRIFFNKNNMATIIPVKDYLENKLYYHSLTQN
jgi:hypothetical protein